MRYKKFGVLLRGGGNQVFFDLGFLQELRRNGIKPSLLIGLSASSAIMFEEIFKCEGEVLKIFGKRLRNNKKNFYLFKKEHFPHNRIYDGAIREILTSHKKYYIPWKILSMESNKRFYTLKSILSTLLLPIRNKKISVKILKFFNIRPKIFSSQDNLSIDDLVNVILGSSMVYPFIKPHFYKNRLILEGGFNQARNEVLFRGLERSLVIRPEKGKTRVVKGVLNVYSTTKTSLNVLDYTDESSIYKIYQQGRDEARVQLAKIKDYLKI